MQKICERPKIIFQIVLAKENLKENKLNVIKNQSAQNQRTKLKLKGAIEVSVLEGLFKIFFISLKDKMVLETRNHDETKINVINDVIRIENVLNRDKEINKMQGRIKRMIILMIDWKL